jgi:hypothetical protein
MLSKLVAIERGVFDDGHEPGQTFGGFGCIGSQNSMIYGNTPRHIVVAGNR